MEHLKDHLPARLFWSALYLMLAWATYPHAPRIHAFGQRLEAIAFTLIAVTLFQRPLVASISTTKAVLVGPAILHKAFAITGITCLVVGIVLRFVLHV